jgi:Zn-dependent M28 family amino/carboxypeptidase
MSRPQVNGDPIWNGADDNASVTVAMLAIGSAWSTQPKRSALFVWHGSEERGLLGSRYFVSHPPLNCLLAAVLNGDMMDAMHLILRHY